MSPSACPRMTALVPRRFVTGWLGEARAIPARAVSPGCALVSALRRGGHQSASLSSFTRGTCSSKTERNPDRRQREAVQHGLLAEPHRQFLLLENRNTLKNKKKEKHAAPTVTNYKTWWPPKLRHPCVFTYTEGVPWLVFNLVGLN